MVWAGNIFVKVDWMLKIVIKKVECNVSVINKHNLIIC